MDLRRALAHTPLDGCDSEASDAPWVTNLECEVRRVVANQLRLDEAELTLVTAVRSPARRAMLPQLWLALEVEFDVQLADDEVSALRTLADVVALIRAQLRR